MRVLHLLVALILAGTALGACANNAESSDVVLQCSDPASEHNSDQDADGYSPCEGDCDDADPNANPGTPEASETDQYDQDCDNFNPTRE